MTDTPPAAEWCSELERELHEEAAASNSTPTAKASLPTPRPWLDIALPKDDDSVLIGPGRWLTRGSGCFVIAPTGSGKSTWSATQAFSWGLGLTSLGLVPSRPLKSLIFQAEDDDGDLIDMRDGILGSIAPSEAERQLLRERVLVVTERAATGIQFLNEIVAPLLAEHRPDLLWLNPLSAYFGADLNDQQAVTRFFRNTLNPLLEEFGCAAIPIHHTPKPSKERKEWQGGELAYLGPGWAVDSIGEYGR